MQRGATQDYQHTLGAIGRYLDQHSYEDILLCELGDGFVGRVLQDGRLLAAIPFQASDLNGMVRAAADETPRAPASVPQPGVRRGHFFCACLAAIGPSWAPWASNSIEPRQPLSSSPSCRIQFWSSIGVRLGRTIPAPPRRPSTCTTKTACESSWRVPRRILACEYMSRGSFAALPPLTGFGSAL